MNILIIDLETSGLDPATSKVVEVGVILWSVTHATTVAMYSSLVEGSSNAAQHINGIPPSSLAEGATENLVWTRLAAWLERADYLVAHNAAFDRQFVPAGWDQGKPWIDSMEDIEFPQHTTSRSLVAIALAHGLGVSHAHRALTDCTLIARILERCHELGHDVEDMLRQGARPKSLYRAIVSYDDRERARAAGFTWNPTTKQWTKRLCDENVTAFPFRVERVA